MTRKSTAVTGPIPGMGARPRTSRVDLKTLRAAFAFGEIAPEVVALRIECASR
jgi:hypothetical protein